MPSLAHSILKIQEGFGAKTASDIIRRLVRVPEALVALQEQDVLDEVLQLEAESVTPSAIARRAFDIDSLNASGWEGASRSKVEASAADGGTPLHQLAGCILQAADILAHARGAPDTAGGLSEMSPSAWALAYAEMAHGRELHDLLTKFKSTAARSSLHNAMLAEHGPQRWLEIVDQHELEVTASDVTSLASAGEDQIASQLAEILLRRSTSAKSASTAPSFNEAVLLTTTGAADRGQQSLEEAWEDSIDRTAAIADAMAGSAMRSGDNVLEVQARQRSLEIRPTPRRRAELALAHLRAGDTQQALLVLSDDAEATEELVAIGRAQLALGDRETAKSALRKATPSASELEGRWLQSLITGWIDLGELGQAVRLLDEGVDRFPGHLPLRRRFAQVCLEAGMTGKASDQAAILATACPALTEAKVLLAKALRADGQPQRALALWLELSENSDQYKAEVVEAALATEDVATALKFSQELVDADPESVTARVCLGRSLVAAGNEGGGQVHLRRATELAPQDPASWLALSAVQINSGQLKAAGETLATARQACPENPEVQAALADWMADQERWTEAVEAIEMARQHDPENAAYMSRHGRWLYQMGEVEKAMSALEMATARRPQDWEARLSLARIYESKGSAEAAFQHMRDLPVEAPGEAHYLAGRVALQMEADPATAREALSHLKQARENGSEDRATGYWIGRALQALGRHDEAIKSYQSCQQSLTDREADLLESCLRGTAECALDSNQVPMAISVLERVREFEQPKAETLALLSKAYIAGGLADEALPPVIGAWETEPTNEKIRAQFIAAARAAGDSRLALEKIIDWRSEHTPDAKLLLEQADLHHQLGEEREARKAIAEAIWRERREPEVLKEAGIALLEIGETGSAKRILAAAEERLPEDLAVVQALARAAQHDRDAELARRVWDKLLAAEPDSMEALVGAADANWQLDQRVTAIGHLQRAVSRSPSTAYLHAKLARYQLANGEVQPALSHFRTAVECSPDDEEIVLEATEAFLADGSAREALEVLGPTAEGAIEDPRVVALMADAYLQNDQAERALMVLRRLPDKESSPAIHALFSLAEGAAGRPAASEERLQQALEGRLKTAREAALLTRAALRIGRWDDAISVAHGLISAGGDSRGLLIALTTICRVADAHRLFVTLASASARGPASTAIADDQLQMCLEAAERLRSEGLPVSQVEALRWRAEVAFGRLSSGEEPAISALPRDRRIRQHALEGVVLRHVENQESEAALAALAGDNAAPATGPWAGVLAGAAHLIAGRPSMSRKALGAVGNDPLLRPLAAFLAGQSWARESRWTEAINNLNTAVLEWPEEPNWQRDLAELYVHDGRPEASLAHLQQALELEPGHAPTQLQLARTLAQTGQLSEADSAYQHALKKQSYDAEVLLEAASVAFETGQPARAAQLYTRALEDQPENPLARVGAARAALAQGDVRRAQEHTAGALRQAPNDPDVLIGLGDIFADQEEYEQALAMYEDARRRCDDPHNVDRARGRVLLKMGRTRQAIDILQAAVQAEPDADESWAYLAQAYQAAGQPGEAIDALRMAIRLRPGSSRYRLRLARLFRERGQLDQALSVLMELEQEAPEDHRIALERGLVHEARRQLREALNAYQRAIELNGASPAAHYHAGMVLKALKAYPHAAQQLQRAVDLSPDDSQALQQLAAVRALELVHGGIQPSGVTP